MTAASSPRAGVAVLAPFCFGYYVSYLLRTINAVIAPDLAGEMGLGHGDLGLLTSFYFFAFAVAQLPVGVALDRFGPRRVVSALMVVAGGGAAVFAAGHHFATLAAGRALVGLGVSACLMGALKAMHDHFPASRHTSLTAVVMAAGTLGALSATSPLRVAVPLVGWRGVLVAASVLGLAAALVVLVVVPPMQAAPAGGPRRQGGSLAGLAAVLRARPFWRFAPQAALFTGGFMAIQGLWIVPWMMAVEGRSSAGAATVLMLLTVAMLCGQLTIGLGAPAAERAGIDRMRLMTTSLALSLLALGLAVTGLAAGPLPWLLFGFFAAAGAQVYGVTTAQFATHLSGRVSTALNLLAFSGAFAVQWGIGVAVEALAPRTGTATAFRLTFAGLWLLQAGALAWSVPRGRARAT